MAYHGKFQPKNISKYKGDYKKITWRSLWELKMLQWCDVNKAVLKYSSEEVVIRYFDPVKNKKRSYYMDFWVHIQKPDGSTFEALIEVKPAKESDFYMKALKSGVKPSSPRPKPKGDNPKTLARWYQECCTAATNTAKWDATREWIRKNQPDMKFMIFTERELGIDQGKAKTERKRAQTKKYKSAQKSN